MGKNNTYQRSDKKFGDYPYLIHLSRGCMVCNPTEDSPMLQYNMEVKEENDAFGGRGEFEVPAKKVFMLINTSDYQGDGPCVQFMCGWKDFEVNGFAEEDYYHCMMRMDINEMVNCSKTFGCDYEGVLIVCVAANSHMDYIKRELEEREQVLVKGKESYRKLVEFVQRLDFDKAYKELGGFNLENNEFFDCDFESISATIYRNEDGTCRVGDWYEVWCDEKGDHILVKQ